MKPRKAWNYLDCNTTLSTSSSSHLRHLRMWGYYNVSEEEDTWGLHIIISDVWWSNFWACLHIHPLMKERRDFKWVRTVFKWVYSKVIFKFGGFRCCCCCRRMECVLSAPQMILLWWLSKWHPTSSNNNSRETTTKAKEVEEGFNK